MLKEDNNRFKNQMATEILVNVVLWEQVIFLVLVGGGGLRIGPCVFFV